jgi:hypothetical protein
LITGSVLITGSALIAAALRVITDPVWVRQPSMAPRTGVVLH